MQRLTIFIGGSVYSSFVPDDKTEEIHQSLETMKKIQEDLSKGDDWKE